MQHTEGGAAAKQPPAGQGKPEANSGARNVWSVVAAAIAALGVAGAAWVGGAFADASARGATNVRLIEVAVGILQGDPKRPSTGALRAWATRVIDKYSDVPLDSQARRALRDSVALPVFRVVPSIRTEQSPWQGQGVTPAIDITCTRDGLCDTTYLLSAPDTGQARKKRR
jgi:hypothetical protein